MKSIAVNVFSTDWGTIRTATTDAGLAIIVLPGETKKYFDNQVAALAGNTPITTGGSINTRAEKQLREAAIPCETVLLSRKNEEGLPFVEKSFDIIISFNSPEHLYPLDRYLIEIKRIKPSEN